MNPVERAEAATEKDKITIINSRDILKYGQQNEISQLHELNKGFNLKF